MEQHGKNFTDFPPVTTEEWEKKIREDLKGADYDKKLVWNTNDGFSIRPYYREEDLDGLTHLELPPAEYPFVRGTRKTAGWDIMQSIPVYKAAEANQKANRLLHAGVTALNFRLPGPETDLSALLQRIPLEKVPVWFSLPTGHEELLDAYVSLVAGEGLDKSRICGGLDADPLIGQMFRGHPGTAADAMVEELFKILEKTGQSLPCIRPVTIRADLLHNSGAHIVQELAFALAAGSEYLFLLGEAGLQPDLVASSIQFCFATGSNYFPEIAKLRAARLLWAKIVAQYNPTSQDACRMVIHTVGSGWNQTIYDAHNNMLRATTEAMSAIIGGTDSHEALPYDRAFSDGSEFSERMARNIQVILREEAFFDKVCDPGGGSYYIEKLTDIIAEHAWNRFSSLESNGGFLKAATEGTIQEEIRQNASERFRQVADRRVFILGINQFPNHEEKIPFTDSLPEKIRQMLSATAHDNQLITDRGAREFEATRLKTQQAEKVPVVFLFPAGNVAMRRARATFAGSFFAAAGFEIIDQIGYHSVEAGMKEVNSTDPDILVLCSADEEYPQIAARVLKLLRRPCLVVVAGSPVDHMEKLKNTGIEHFIHQRSDMLGELKKYQSLLGIN